MKCPGFRLAHVTASKPSRCLCMTGRGESSGNCRRSEGGEGEVGVNAFQFTEEKEELRLAAEVQVLGGRLIRRCRDTQRGLASIQAADGQDGAAYSLAGWCPAWQSRFSLGPIPRPHRPGNVAPFPGHLVPCSLPISIQVSSGNRLILRLTLCQGHR